ncbi:MAG: hypothetical protein AAF623_18585, partial [Planctomycetota bacterium]
MNQGIRYFVINTICVLLAICLASSVVAQEKGESEKPATVQESVVGQTLSVQESDAPNEEETSEVATKVAEPIRIASEQYLPASTKAWLSIPNPRVLEKAFESTQIGELAQRKEIKPFKESLEKQAQQWFKKQDVRLGIKLEDLHDVHSGEVCIAGVFPDVVGNNKVADLHGLILLMDVSETEEKAIALQKKMNAEQIKKGATVKEIKINGITATQVTISNPKRFLKSQTNLQAIVNGWFLACDNVTIFRDVLRKLADPAKIKPQETLSAQKAFSEVMSQTELGSNTQHIRWFVDPFGYAELAQALKDEERVSRPRSDSWVAILKQQGFSAWKGIGGKVSVATGEHEFLHQTFTYVPSNNNVPNYKRMMDLFDFSGKPLEVAPWVPEDCSGYVTMNWKMEKALESIGHIFDARIEEEGAWDRMLYDLKIDIDTPLDVKKLVGLIDNRITIVAAVNRPIDDNSERVVISVPIKKEEGLVLDSLKTALRGEVLNLGGNKVIKVENSNDYELDEDLPGGPFDLPEDDFEEEEQPRFELFAKKYFAVKNRNLIVTNNKEYMKKLLVRKESKLAAEVDYQKVKNAIGQFTDDKKICWRQFGRLDRTLEANYETLRRGEMGNSQTILGRLVNQMIEQQKMESDDPVDADPSKIRQQKLDNAKLPQNYQKEIAPFLGPMGWVMESESEGWR